MPPWLKRLTPIKQDTQRVQQSSRLSYRTRHTKKTPNPYRATQIKHSWDFLLAGSTIIFNIGSNKSALIGTFLMAV